MLVIAGSRGKTGAAAMSGMAALRAGAGLVTVASAESAIPVIASHAAELMTEVLDPARIDELARNKTVLAIGPGLGTAAEDRRHGARHGGAACRSPWWWMPMR